MKINCLALALLALALDARAFRIGTTTTLIADIARQVAGPDADVQSFVPYDADPHAFQPTPHDVAELQASDVVLINGLGLETPFVGILGQLPRDRVVVVSRTIKPRHLGDAHATGDGHAHAPGSVDPHVWLSPALVTEWVKVIADELASRDPSKAEGYRRRSADLQKQLANLDRWASESLRAIPPANRKLVADHDAFGYFAERYGFEVVGSISPGASTLAEPTARDLAELADAIRAQGVRAILTEPAAPHALASGLADSAAIPIIELPTCALNAPGGAVSTYEAYFRKLVSSLLKALGR